MLINEETSCEKHTDLTSLTSSIGRRFVVAVCSTDREDLSRMYGHDRK